MSTHNIPFHDKIRNKSLNICFVELSEELRRTQKEVRISLGKRGIRVRAIEVRLYFAFYGNLLGPKYCGLSSFLPTS